MKPWSERLIARAISKQVLHDKCIVLLPNTIWPGHECDVLGVTMDRRLIEVEVKISRADLRRDSSKEKWWHKPGWEWGNEGPPQLLGWPPKVWKHYYALPQDIWSPELMEALPSPHSGVLLLRHGSDFDGLTRNAPPPVIVNVMRYARPARDCARITADDALDVARLANIRFWEIVREQEVAAT